MVAVHPRHAAARSWTVMSCSGPWSGTISAPNSGASDGLGGTRWTGLEPSTVKDSDGLLLCGTPSNAPDSPGAALITDWSLVRIQEGPLFFILRRADLGRGRACVPLAESPPAT